MILDVHCHYVLSGRRADPGIDRFSFEPATQRDSRGPTWDACVAPRTARRLAWGLMQRMIGIDPRLRPGDELDAAIERVFHEHLFAAGPIERYVLLAFDWYHATDGTRAPLPREAAALGSDMFTSNSFVRALCERYPERFLFGASVHPYRRNAVSCVEEVSAAGACLLKWLPVHQNIDVFDPRVVTVLNRCAELGLPLLVHYGDEFSLRAQHPEQTSVGSLLEVLRRLRRRGRMPTVIVAHLATPNFGSPAGFEALCDALLGEFREAPLYADISALTTWVKAGYLRRVAERQDLHAKLLFGSDFPVPLAWPRLRGLAGRDLAGIRAVPSWPQQAALLGRRAGFNEIVFRRAAQILPNVDFFARRAATAAT